MSHFSRQAADNEAKELVQKDICYPEDPLDYYLDGLYEQLEEYGVTRPQEPAELPPEFLEDPDMADYPPGLLEQLAEIQRAETLLKSAQHHTKRRF